MKIACNLDLLGNRGINVADPVADTDIANKRYVDAHGYSNRLYHDTFTEFVDSDIGPYVTTSYAVGESTSMVIHINGLRQSPQADYTSTSDGTGKMIVTFTGDYQPVDGDLVEIDYSRQ